MRIAWVSAAAYATTGYGKVTKEVLKRLRSWGIDVMNVGGTGGTAVWGGKTTHEGIPVLPILGHQAGADVVPQYIKRYRVDVIVALWDCFVLGYFKDIEIPRIMYAPIDSEITSTMKEHLSYCDHNVAMSMYGYRHLLKAGFSPRRVSFIPHGVDTKVYRPADPGEKKRLRSYFGLPEGSVVLLTVAANYGERKQIPLLMHELARFKNEHPDINFIAYIFTNARSSSPYGYDLVRLRKDLGAESFIKFPEYDPIYESWGERELADLYRASDIYVSLSFAEGFGLPILEAMACGLPVICVNTSSMTELVGENEERGWLVKTIPSYRFYPVWIPTLQSYSLPDPDHFREVLHEAITNEEERSWRGFRGAMHARHLDWDGVAKKWVALLDRIAEEFT